MKHVLIVDDEDTLRALLREEIEELGHHCSDAEHGEAALKVVAEAMPDLILCDGAMPILDGPSFIKRLNATYGADAAPVIIISALNTENDIRQAAQSGAVDYIRKPIDFDHLHALIAKHL